MEPVFIFLSPLYFWLKKEKKPKDAKEFNFNFKKEGKKPIIKATQ